MYFKDFPSFLYDFNYGNGKTKTAVLKDVTRNIRFKKEILSNVALYDQYDIIDGETPEIISDKFYGTPEYHWIIMLANEKYDYLKDFPLQETFLQKHIETTYNPTLHSTDWSWTAGILSLKVDASDVNIPFNTDYLTAPVTITISGAVNHVIRFPVDPIILDNATQVFSFPYEPEPTETGTLTINTIGRENNPIVFTNQAGQVVQASTPFASPVTGAELHRLENDSKRRIKIISPALIETIIRNYEDFLR